VEVQQMDERMQVHLPDNFEKRIPKSFTPLICFVPLSIQETRMKIAKIIPAEM